MSKLSKAKRRIKQLERSWLACGTYRSDERKS